MSDKATPWTHSAGTIYDSLGAPVADMVNYDPNSPYIDAVAVEAQIDERIDLILSAVNSHDALVEACEMAMAFIINGAVFGYITMPDDDVPDSAKDTPRVLAAALALARGET